MVSPAFASVITDNSLLVLEEFISHFIGNRHSTRVQSTDHVGLSLGDRVGASDGSSHETVVNPGVRASSVTSLVGSSSLGSQTAGLGRVSPGFMVPTPLTSVSVSLVGTVQVLLLRELLPVII